MATIDDVLRIRIDGQIKAKAAAVLAEIGISISDAVRMLLHRIAAEKALPFEVRIPNKLTAKTLRQSARGEDLHKAKDADDLFRQLGI